MSKPEKLYSDKDETAVLYSPGYGAGWSTWATGDGQPEFLMFDKTLVLMAERNANESEVEEYLQDKGYDYTYMGGWNQIKVAWLSTGSRFFIDEYDGSESIRTIDDGYTA
jgi:hypothetical protein